MGRVGGEADLDGFAAHGLQFDLVTEVVFHVTVAADGMRDVVFGELFEEDVEGLAKDVGEDAEATAMGHTHDDFLNAEFGTVFDEGIEGRDHGLATFEGEAFLADEAGVEEFFEELGFEEAAEDAGFLAAGEGGAIVRGLHAGLKPVAGVEVLHVQVFHADVSAVGFVEGGDERAKLHLAAAFEIADGEGEVEVGLGQAEVLVVKTGKGCGGRAERIEMRLHVAMGAVGVDEAEDLSLLGAVDDGGGRAADGGAQAGAVAAEAEALEEGAPRGINRIGVLKPDVVGRLDDIGVGVRGEGEGVHGDKKANRRRP